MPAAYALLSDTFPRRQLATALGVFSFGATFGIAISLGLGGYLLALFARSRGIETPLGHLDPWQAAFVIAGCPPLVFGLLALTLPEPTRKKRASGHPPAATPLLAVLRRRRGIMTAQFAGFSMNALMGYTLMAWAPAFMSRSYGWRPGEIGPALALALGLSGAIATLGSGYLADRMWARGINGSHYILAASALAVSSPFGVVAFLSPSPWIFLAGIFVVYFAAAVSLNMGATSLQLLTPPALRGRVSGLYLFCTNMFGAGLGPLIVAMLTQHLFHDRAKVGIAMAIVTPTAALSGAIILGLAWRRYAKLIADAEDSIEGLKSIDIAASGAPVLGTKS
jgi:MFS family permease